VKACLITSTNRTGSCATTAVMVHLRNALILHRELGLDLIEGEADAHKLRENQYDHIICNYASFYIPWQAYLDAVINSQAQARLWWMVNDHDVEDNVLLRHVLKATNCQRTYGVISNNSRAGFRQWILRKWITRDEKRLNDCIDQWHTVNINALTYEDRSHLPPAIPDQYELFPDEYPVLYWGSWRKWRLPYFLKYSHPEVVFSTSTKNRLKLIRNGCRFQFIRKIRWGEESELLKATATIYLEDPHTHRNFAFPANRFYEAVGYGVQVFFDPSCRRNAEQFGYDDLIFVNSAEEALALAKAGRQPVSEKWKEKARAEKTQALAQIKGILD
jgi:hypothetical protein